MKKVGSIILALIMLVSFTACGGKSSKSDDPNVGMWKAVAASMMDMTMDVSEVFDEGASLELKENEKFELIMDGERANGKWEYNDGVLTLTGDGLDLNGTIESDILTLTNMLDMGLDLMFEKEGSNAFASLPKASDDAGYYILEEATEDGEIVTGDELREMGYDYYVLLNDDGTAVCQTDNIATGTWENGMLDLYNDEGDSETLDYKIEGDELTIVWDTLTLVYLRSSGTPSAQPVETGTGSAEKLSEVQQWWDGDWYGYWEPHSVTDNYKHIDDGRWDIYARIEMNSDDTGVLYLWEDGEDFATVDITVSVYGGAGDMGAAVSESGHYWAGDEISHADWIIDPSLYGYENYMVIDGRYEDEFDEGFNYVVYLRPWGLLWDDIPEDERPPWYDDWYLATYTEPMIESILNSDGFIHTELVDTLVTEKPVSPAPAGEAATEPPVPSAPAVEAATETPAPSAPAGGSPIEAQFEMAGVMISATLPGQGWCPQDTPFGYNLYQVKSCDDVYSNSPRISINIKPDLKDFDLHLEDFENLQTLQNRTIGGIDMTGRAYENIGMNWIEYLGMLNGAHAVSVKTSNIDISSEEVSAILDSIKFTGN